MKYNVKMGDGMKKRGRIAGKRSAQNPRDQADAKVNEL
jgi:hypothetical protein